MSALLEIVSELRDVRDSAQAELIRAMRRAKEEGGHTLEEIGKAADLSKQRVSQILRGEKTQ